MIRFRSCARGSCGASSGANSATRMKRATRTKPMIAPGLRRSRRNASDQRPPWPSNANSLDSSSATDTLLLPSEPDAGVDQAVRDVDEQVHEHDDDRDEQDPALDHRVVPVADRLSEPRADARVREDGLGEDRSGEQQPHLEP